jgi:hypothetical protein
MFGGAHILSSGNEQLAAEYSRPVQNPVSFFIT